MERSHPPARAVRFGLFEADLQSGELHKSGQRVRIQEQPFQILAALLERPGKIVTREELRQRIWPDDVFVDFDHSLATAIKKVREALGDDAHNPRFIETMPHRGYRFIYPVHVGADQRVRPTEGAHIGAPLRKRWLAALAAVVLVTAAAVLVALNIGGLRDRLLGGPNLSPIDSVAVLPFHNVNGDPEVEYLSDGLTGSLINQLAQLPELQVMGRSTVFHYKGSGVDPRQAGREMKVGAVVTGRVLQRGDSLVVGVELLDVARGTQLWGEQYNRKMADLFTVQGDIARIISRTLRLKLTSKDQRLLARRHTPNTQAYELYLKSRINAWAGTMEKLQMSVEYARLAIQADPDFALGYAALADAYAMMGGLDVQQAAEVFPRAREAALKALEIDETLPDPHGALGLVKMNFEWDWSGAEKEIQRAIELAPNRADFHGLRADFLIYMGRLEDAEAEAKRAVDLDPFAPREVLLRVYLYARRYDDALREAKRTLEYNPDAGMAQPTVSYSYQLKGMYDEHIAIVEKWPHVLELSAEDMPAGRKVYESRGWQAFKDWHTEQLEKKRRQGQPVTLFILAMAHAEANHKEEALRWLEKAYEQRNWTMITLQRWPAWDSLRSDPRFQDLVRRMNFPE